ncbi:hypothetical protein, partial [Halomonas sp. 707D4]|uniref:hypothetical protein n=1 Tax=Halomonas sp. 707D4 TaxID=1904455 RepID=UPI00209F4425
GYADSLRGLGLSNDQLAQRVANASNAVRLLDANTARMNLQFNAAADGALISADAMAQQAGGVDNLSGLMSSFYQSFFTDGERAAHLQGEITDALASMGMALPENIAGFRALVEAQNQNTAEGARNYVQLLQLSDGFVQLQQMMGDAEGATDGLNAAIRSNADIAREREQLELQLLRAEGDVTEIRRRELAALDASNRPLQERLHAIEDEAEATKASNDVVREYQQLELQLLREQGNTTELRRRELAALHESNRPLQQRIWALQDEAATYSQHLVTNGNVDTIRRAYDTYNASIEAINEGARLREQQLANEQRALTTLRDLTDSLMLSSQSVLDPMERMQEAQRQLSRLQIQAEAGDTNAIGQLQGATTAYLDSIAAVYGQSSAQYAAEFESVSRSMQALENRYGDSVRALGTQESISRDALRDQQRARDLLTRQLQQQADMYGELDSIAHLLEYLPQELASALSSILDNGKPGGGIGLAQVISGARNAHGYLDDAGARVVYDYLKNTGGTLSDANRYLKPGANTAEDWARRNGLPLFDTGAWNLGGDTLAMVHKNEFIAPAKGGIADEFRAYAAGDYQAELLGELHRLQQGLTQRPAMAPVSGNDQALLRAFAAMREDNRRLTEQVGAMEQQLAAIVKNTGAVIDPARRTAMATEGAERSTRLKKRNPA